MCFCEVVWGCVREAAFCWVSDHRCVAGVLHRRVEIVIFCCVSVATVVVVDFSNNLQRTKPIPLPFA